MLFMPQSYDIFYIQFFYVKPNFPLKHIILPFLRDKINTNNEKYWQYNYSPLSFISVSYSLR